MADHENFDEVLEMYDRIAPNYDAMYSGPEYEYEDNLVRKIFRRQVNEGDSVVDLGCGTGAALDVLPANVGYQGFDISERMLEVARSKHPSREFIHADMASLPVKSESASVVVSTFGSLSHASHIDLVLEEIDRILAPSGRIVLMVYGLKGKKRSQRTVLVNYELRAKNGGLRSSAPAWLYRAQDYRSHLNLYFRDVRIRGLTIIQPFCLPSWMRPAARVIDVALCAVAPDKAQSLIAVASKNRTNILH